MSRPLRIEYPGAVYHVMNRGLNQALIFKNKKDYGVFIFTLEESCRLFDVRVYAYCLMPNHYHLLIRTPSGNISRFMRHLNGVYTQRFNREHHRDGPLYRGRYKSILVQEDSYLIEVVRYIHKNPLKAKLVERLSQFKWSSHKSYTEPKGSLLGLDTGFVLGYFSRKKKVAIEQYKRFMTKKESGEIKDFYGSKKQGSILGDINFVEQIKEKYISSGPDIEILEKRKIQGEGIVGIVKKEVCRIFKVDVSTLYQSKRGTANVARSMALFLSKELSGLTLSELGLLFGFSNYRTVGTHCWKFGNKIKTDKSLGKMYVLLKKTCRKKIIS